MEIVTDCIQVSTRGNAEMVDLTRELENLLKGHGFLEGSALVFVAGSTAALTTVEYEPGLVKDLPALFDRLAPRTAHYHHEDTWHDGNGHSHVRASLLGPSIIVPFNGGRLLLGEWQQVVLLDFDNRSRKREVVVQFTGTRSGP